MEIGVWASPIRAYRDARKILDSLAGGQKGEKINKANFSAGSRKHWAVEGTSWKSTALKVIDKLANLRKVK